MGFPVNLEEPGFRWNEVEYSEGTLSALHSQDGKGENYQFTAPIRPGNSGGAIIFENGSLAGIAVAGYDSVKTFLSSAPSEHRPKVRKRAIDSPSILGAGGSAVDNDSRRCNQKPCSIDCLLGVL